MTRLALLFTLLLAAPASAQEVVHEKYVPVTNSAGETITVDIWRPAAEGRYPVIMEQSPYRDWQTPYPTKQENPSNGGNPTEWAQRGYVFVFADVPGTGGSTGQWCLWCKEQVDSAVSILEWAAGQPWSNGNIGWHGNSYPGILGLLVAERAPPALKALRIAAPYGDLYDDFAYIGGVQRGEDLQFLATGFTGLSRDSGPYCVPGATCDAESWANAWTTRATSPLPSFYEDLTTRKLYSDWYRERSIVPNAHKIVAPTLMLGGWEDMFARGTVNVYRAIKVEKRLVMSGSTHVPVFPAADAQAVNRAEEERWFDRHLRGAPDEAEPGGRVRLFTEGGPGWRSFRRFPPPTAPLTLTLGEDSQTRTIDPASGRAGGRWLFRVVTPDTPEEHYSPDGPADQNGETPSVITYRTEPLEQDLELTGVPRAHLVAETTAADTILNVRLIHESPGGTSLAYLVDAGWTLASLRDSRSVPAPPQPGVEFEADVELYPLSYVFQAGSRIRVDIAFADTPRMAAPPSGGETTVHLDRSNIVLPVATCPPRATVTRRRPRLRGTAECAVGVAVRAGRKRFTVPVRDGRWRVRRKLPRGRAVVRPVGPDGVPGPRVR